jgi:hypothetical protein
VGIEKGFTPPEDLKGFGGFPSLGPRVSPFGTLPKAPRFSPRPSPKSPKNNKKNKKKNNDDDWDDDGSGYGGGFITGGGKGASGATGGSTGGKSGGASVESFQAGGTQFLVAPRYTTMPPRTSNMFSTRYGSGQILEPPVPKPPQLKPQKVNPPKLKQPKFDESQIPTPKLRPVTPTPKTLNPKLGFNPKLGLGIGLGATAVGFGVSQIPWQDQIPGEEIGEEVIQTPDQGITQDGTSIQPPWEPTTQPPWEPTTQIQPPVQTQIQPPFLPPRMPPSFRFGGAGPQEYQQSMKSSNKLWKVYEAGDVPFGTIQSGLGYYEQTKKGEFFSLKQGRRSKGFLDVW